MDPKDRKPEMNPGGKWEQDLESVRSALSGLESVEPPDLLDQAVLNTARRELAASRRKPMRWVGAFATAAVVVLALSIVIQQDRKIPDPRIGNGIKLDASRPTEAEKEIAIGTSAMLESQVASPRSSAASSSEESPRLEQQPVERKRQNNALSNVAAEPPAEADYAAKKVIRQVSEDSDYRPAEKVSEEVLPDPVAWIEKMLELKQTEQYEELKHELEAFRKAYPDYPLPPQLQD